MLVVFLMTAVTFVVVARHYNQAAKASSNANRVAASADHLLDEAVYDLIRDTDNRSRESASTACSEISTATTA